MCGSGKMAVALVLPLLYVASAIPASLDVYSANKAADGVDLQRLLEMM